MTQKEYLRDSSLSGAVEVVEVIPADKTIVRTKTTWFHPQGGGQKADRGTIGGVEVYNVRHADNGQVDHYVASGADLRVGETYQFAIDPIWRTTNSVYHSAGHLLATVCEAMFADLKAVAGHQWPGEARVDFVGTELQEVIDSIDEIDDRLRAELKSDLPVVIVGDPFDSRMIQMGDYTPIPCGGTHVSRLGEIGRMSIRSKKIRDGVLRLGYEAFPS